MHTFVSVYGYMDTSADTYRSQKRESDPRVGVTGRYELPDRGAGN